ncbi:ATP-binding protein [Bacillus salitolerans]|uniref:histidine kinase n=1 Tax=Bacillus salitolerans TaxID=1437434 RepID=A0ABW4LWI5_9BACI
MFTIIEQFSYHILVILLPLFSYHLFMREEQSSRSRIRSKFFLVLFIMLIFTMQNPIYFSDEYHYDFRVIPIILGVFFGGIRPGIGLIIVMLVYRFSLGDHEFSIALLNYSIAACIIILLKRKIEVFTLKSQLLILTCIYFLITFTRAISLIYVKHFDLLVFISLYSLITWALLVMIVYIINNVDMQIENQKHIQVAERLNTVSQLAASIAHEVRNPMTAIKGFLQLIRKDTNLTEEQIKYIDISLDELKRTEAIINDYLSLSKPSKKDSNTRLNISSELKSITEVITSYTNTNTIAISSTIEEELYCKGKRNEFKQAIINIMKNSVEAIGANGNLTVKAYKRSNKVYIDIKDDGIGMTKKQTEQLGTPYYSTKDKGTGVGLTITYRIIREMNGDILVQSTKGVGTVFTVALPFDK